MKYLTVHAVIELLVVRVEVGLRYAPAVSTEEARETLDRGQNATDIFQTEEMTQLDTLAKMDAVAGRCDQYTPTTLNYPSL